MTFWASSKRLYSKDKVTSANLISPLNFSYHLTQIVTAFVNILVDRGYMLKIWPGEVGGEGGGTKSG